MSLLIYEGFRSRSRHVEKNNRRHIVDIRKDYFFRITCLRRNRDRHAQRSGEKTINKQTHKFVGRWKG